MKCKKCGGELRHADGTYVCQNCGIIISIVDYYEDIDTFICYIENDSVGRRTKDSIIAQKIYHNLESKKIKTFYSRISASDLFGDELQLACDSAIIKSKTIIILGSQKEYFETLLSKYADFFSQKVVIPVYIDMEPYHMPSNISSVQALDYNKIGADADLTKALLRALNRDEELTYEKISKKSSSRKIIISVVVIAVFILAGAALLYLFLNGKEVDNSDLSETVTDETALEDPDILLYNNAIAFMGKEEYEKAMINLLQLSGYKDSDKLLQKIYNRYAGYYKNDSVSIDLHLQIISGNTLVVEISNRIDGNIVKITESAQIHSNKNSLNFNDSENNHGTITIEFKDQSINLSIKTEDINSDIYIRDIDIAFSADEKSDKPFAEKVDRSTLLEFVNKRTTLSDLERKGYDILFESSLYKGEDCRKYRLKDTEIRFAIYTFDVSKTDMRYAESNNSVDDPIVFGISAPAGIVIPDYIGMENIPFIDNDIIYVPDGELSQDYLAVDFCRPDNIENRVINSDTPVCFTSKSLIGEKHFNDLAKEYKNLTTVSETTTIDILAGNKVTSYYADVNTNELNIRQGPGTNYEVVGNAYNGDELYIIAESIGLGSSSGWGKIDGDKGWIALDYVDKSE